MRNGCISLPIKFLPIFFASTSASVIKKAEIFVPDPAVSLFFLKDFLFLPLIRNVDGTFLFRLRYPVGLTRKT